MRSRRRRKNNNEKYQNKSKIKEKAGKSTSGKKFQEESPVLGIKENKVFLTGYNPNPYNRMRLHELLSDKIPGYMNVILPKAVYKGFAFIDVRTTEDVKKCLKMKQVILEGHKMILKEFKKGKELKEERIYMNEKKVFINQIPRDWTTKDLREVFSKFGPLEEIYMCFKKNENPDDLESVGSKIGFAIYKKKEIAEMIYSKGTVLYKDVVLKVKKVEDRANLYGERIIESETSSQNPMMKKEVNSMVFSERGEPVLSISKKSSKLKSIQPELKSKSSVDGSFNLTKDECSQILKEGFKEIFAKLGIDDFDFEEFIKFSAFQYLQSKKIMMMRKQTELLNVSPQGPDQRQQSAGNSYDLLQNVFGGGKELEEMLVPQVTKEEAGVNKIEIFRKKIRFHASRPTSSLYHEMLLEYGYKVDHKMRNLRVNGGKKNLCMKKFDKKEMLLKKVLGSMKEVGDGGR